MPEIYIGQWEWNVSDPANPHWRTPGGDAIGMLDLRSNNQIQRGPLPQGAGLFVYDGLRSHSLLLRRLGNNLERNVSSVARNLLAQHMNIPIGSIKSTTIERVIRELFISTLLYDPRGLSLHKPVRFGSDRRVRIVLGGFGDVVNDPVTRSHPSFDTTLAVFQADYRRNRVDLVDKGFMPLDSLRRYTGSVMKKLTGRMGDDLVSGIVPLEYEADGWLPPKTTIGDTFVEAINTALGIHTATGPNGGFGWTVLSGSATVLAASDAVQSGSAGANLARADSDLSTDDNDAEVDYIAHGSSNGSGPITRKDSTATVTFYTARYDDGPNESQLFKFVGGVPTLLDTDATVRIPPFNIRVQANGSAIKGFHDDSEILSASDTSITGNLRAGFRAFLSGWEADNFEAADLEVPVNVGNLPPYGQVIFNSADEENRPQYGQPIARVTE